MTSTRPRQHLFLSARPLLVACAASCALGAGAQEASSSQARGLSVVPNAGVRQTITDNALLDDSKKRADAIAVLTTGVRLASRGGQVEGFLDYQLSGSVYARETHGNELNNSLRAALKSELIDNFLYVDAAASISQQTISAFGVQSQDSTLNSANRTEVRSLSVEPSLRGLFGRWAAYDLRGLYAQQSAETGELGDSTNRNLTATLRSSGPGRVGWLLSASSQNTEYDAGRSTTTEALKGQLSYTPFTGLQLSASAGREKSDLLRDETGPVTTWGAGLVWTPSERTRLSLQRDKRFFGDAHAVNFEYRTPRTTWRFNSVRDVSNGTPGLARGGSTALFNMLDALYASVIENAAARREFVLAEMRRMSQDPNLASSFGFLQSEVTLTNRQDFAVAYRGLRTTVTLTATRSDSRSLEGTGPRSDDLSRSDRIRQSDLSLSVSHRLTASDSLNLILSDQRTRGDTASQANEMRTISLNWGTRLGPRSDISLGARRVDFDSVTTPYTENAIFATLAVRF